MEFKGQYVQHNELNFDCRTFYAIQVYNVIQYFYKMLGQCQTVPLVYVSCCHGYFSSGAKRYAGC